MEDNEIPTENTLIIMTEVEKSDRRRSSDRKGRLSEREIEKMKKMASKVGIKVREDKKAVVITKVLNNFERKIIHEVISKMEDITTESFNDSEGNSKNTYLSNR